MNDHTKRLRVALVLGVMISVASPLGVSVQAQRLYNPGANAAKVIDSAVAKAKKEKKLVLVEFGADWCVDCWVLDTLLHNKAVAPIVHDHYVVVKVDVGEFNRNLDITGKYGSPIDSGVPAVVILGPTGKMLASTKTKPWENARHLSIDVIKRQLEMWAKQP